MVLGINSTQKHTHTKDSIYSNLIYDQFKSPNQISTWSISSAKLFLIHLIPNAITVSSASLCKSPICFRECIVELEAMESIVSLITYVRHWLKAPAHFLIFYWPENGIWRATKLQLLPFCCHHDLKVAYYFICHR